MYNFYKVRGQKHRHEFRHPFFKKNDTENLKIIKRKPVLKVYNKLMVVSGDETLVGNRATMVSKLQKMQEILAILGKQNEELVKLNHRMLQELSGVREAMSSKVKALITVMINAIMQPDSFIVDKCRELLAETPLQDPKINSNTYPNSQTSGENTPISEDCHSQILITIDRLYNLISLSTLGTSLDISENPEKSIENLNLFECEGDVVSGSINPQTPSQSRESIGNQQNSTRNEASSLFNINHMSFCDTSTTPQTFYTELSHRTPEDAEFEAFIEEVCRKASWVSMDRATTEEICD